MIRPTDKPAAETLLTRLRDEADLCRNEGATDIAVLLDEAADALAVKPAQPKAAPQELQAYVPGNQAERPTDPASAAPSESAGETENGPEMDTKAEWVAYASRLRSLLLQRAERAEAAREEVLEEAARLVEKRGADYVVKWFKDSLDTSDDKQMEVRAKAYAWDTLQHAEAIRAAQAEGKGEGK